MVKADNKRLVSGAAVLTVGSVIAKLLGAFYRIPLTNILGAEGMGMYQLIFPVYALFMTLSTAGIPTALSRIVAEKRAMGESVKHYLFSAITLLLALSMVFAIITISLARTLARWQGNESVYQGFIIIAPSILFVGVIAGFRGWFQGEMYMLPTAISNIIEQVVKLSLGIGLAVAFSPRGAIWAVNGALIGVTVSELVTMIYMFATYLYRSKGEKSVKLSIDKGEAKGMLRVIFSISIVAILMPLSSFFDSMIIVNMLKLRGVASSVATAEYGLLSGPINSLINMPIVVIMSLAIAIVPSVSRSRVYRDIDGVMLKSRLSVKFAYLIGIPFAIFFTIFADKILSVIYPRLSEGEHIIGSTLLQICSFNVIFISSMQIYISLLQALDKTKMAVLSLVFAIVVKIVLSVILTRFIGIYGSAIASLAMSVVAFMLVNICYFKICGLHLAKNVSKNLLSGVIMGISSFGALYIANDIASLIVGFVISLIVYVALVFMMNIITKEDIAFLPFKRVLIGVRRLVRFWER